MHPEHLLIGFQSCLGARALHSIGAQPARSLARSAAFLAAPAFHAGEPPGEPFTRPAVLEAGERVGGALQSAASRAGASAGAQPAAGRGGIDSTEDSFRNGQDWCDSMV